MTIANKINLLRQELKHGDEEIQNLFDVVILYYPQMFDTPEIATPAMIKGYNRLVNANISNIERRNKLVI